MHLPGVTGAASRSHDYLFLIRRWKRLCRTLRVDLVAYAHSGGFPVYAIETPQRSRRDPATLPIYLSAGIHGDESGSTEGLLAWAERNALLLKFRPFLLFPCLNPWGLVNNCRLDPEGRDLNRAFQSDEIPQVAAHLRFTQGRSFAAAMMLHEDYDAVGAYLYEIRRPGPGWGPRILEAVRPHIAPDSRRRIEGRLAQDGLVWRRLTDQSIPLRPEALHLYLSGTGRVFTFETPSEFAIERRVEAQVAAVDALVSLVDGSTRVQEPGLSSPVRAARRLANVHRARP